MQNKKTEGYFYPVFIFVFAMMLFLIAFQHFRSAFYQLSVNTTLSRLNKGSKVVESELLKGINATKQSIKISDKALYWSNLNRLLFEQARQNGLRALSSRKILKDVEGGFKKSLSSSPADSLLWFKLARLHFLQKSISNETIEALVLSMMIGSHELGYLLPRLNLCMQIFKKFENKDQMLLRSQVLIAWEKSPKLFLQKIVSKKQNMDNIRFLLQNNYPYIVTEMELLLENLSE